MYLRTLVPAPAIQSVEKDWPRLLPFQKGVPLWLQGYSYSPDVSEGFLSGSTPVHLSEGQLP
jgi:hypothetical protein